MAGDVTYTATVEFDGKTYTNPEKKVVTGQALGHDYSDVKFKWSDDYKTATATFTCKNDSKHVETVDATVTSETTAAKCEVDGKTVYTATATLKDGDKEWSGKDTKEVKIPATGHAYGSLYGLNGQKIKSIILGQQLQHSHVQMIRHMYRHLQ